MFEGIGKNHTVFDVIRLTGMYPKQYTQLILKLCAFVPASAVIQYY